jgi:plastocyanin
VIQHKRRSWLALGGLLAAALVGLSSPSSAATRTVTLTNNGPSPATVTINAGDRVTFVNADSTGHTVTDNAGPWSFRASIAPGRSATTSAFTTAGHYGYNDSFFVTVVQQNVEGSIEVRAAAPSPRPTVKPTTKPTPSRTPSPSTSASVTRSSSPTPDPSDSPSATPTATPSPSIGALPVLTLPPTPGPTPAVAPSVAPPVASPTAAIAYGPVSEIAQPSAHRYGLPVLLALLAAAGVLSLLVRFLLAQPAGETAAVRRTRTEGVVDDTDG